MTLVLFAFLAGLATVAAPCILPVLPIVFSGAAAGGRQRSFGVIIGLVISFSILTLLLSVLVRSLGLSPNIGRWFGLVVLIGLGVAMIVPHGLDWFEVWVSRLTKRTGIQQA